jgi:glycosyltransferase involved in cell wall biosynthesis
MISVVCPVYNESAYIKKLLDFYINALPAEKELLLVDGLSTDDTCAIIKQYIARHGGIYLLDNPERIVPYALNKAIEAAKGDIIIRLDAHTDYSVDYFEKIIATFKNTDADIVGGPMRIAKGNAVQNAIGYATCTAFGVGNSSFHFPDYEGYADSVYLGAWKKKIFKTTGLFDVAFKRNQDDEFHYRAKSLGFKIYQYPDIKLYYHPRKTFGLLFKQYYQYGLYKPLVLRKIKSAVSVRHLIPAMFVLYLLSIPAYFIMPFYIGLVPLLMYLFGDIFFTLRSNKSFKEMVAILLVYPTLHLSYGIGFIGGLFKLKRN